MAIRRTAVRTTRKATGTTEWSAILTAAAQTTHRTTTRTAEQTTRAVTRQTTPAAICRAVRETAGKAIRRIASRAIWDTTHGTTRGTTEGLSRIRLNCHGIEQLAAHWRSLSCILSLNLSLKRLAAQTSSDRLHSHTQLLSCRSHAYICRSRQNGHTPHGFHPGGSSGGGYVNKYFEKFVGRSVEE